MVNQAHSSLLRHTWESGASESGLRDKGICIRISIPKSPHPGEFGAGQAVA